MATSGIPYLCGGIFFNLLIQAQPIQEKAHNKQLSGNVIQSDVNVMKELLFVITGTRCNPYDASFRKSVSQYKTCQDNGGTYLPFSETTFINNFDNSVKNDYYTVMSRISDFVATFIDEQKSSWLVKAILDVISQDEEITENDIFYFSPKNKYTKKRLLDEKSFELQPFLLGVLHYIILNRKNNKQGRNTFISWHHKTGKNAKWKFISNIGNEYIRDIKVTASKININNDNRFSFYLNKAREKYGYVKTLLYRYQARPFYDFYVCNDIRQVSDGNNRCHNVIYKNATAQSLATYSRFLLLKGNGGLGKSMMLRHLLLQAINNYSTYAQLPIFISLKEFDDTVDNLLQYLYNQFSPLNPEMDLKEFEHLLAKGNNLLLFDGLDEISTKLIHKFEHSFEVFVDRYSDNLFIISSRPFSSPGNLISFNRFTTLELEPLDKNKALELIDKLDFRSDEPIIKIKFQEELKNKLFITHRSFTENPLLLTIMLMTYEKFSEIPSRMHIFFRKAYSVISQEHDSTKGYERDLRTKLSADSFSDFFAEFCAQTYRDDKFHLSELDFERYFSKLKINNRYNNTVHLDDFIHDLTVNMCLMYYENGKYHFIHRSFQEYFSAVFFSKRRDNSLYLIAQRLFETDNHSPARMNSFAMLYDMIPEKIEEYVFIPFLDDLFKKLDSQNPYWSFLSLLYPTIYYDYGTVDFSVDNTPNSSIYNFIIKTNSFHKDIDGKSLPFNDFFIVDKYVFFNLNWETPTLEADYDIVVDADVPEEYIHKYGIPEIVGWNLSFNISEILSDPEYYKDYINALENDNFPLRKEFIQVKNYLAKLKSNLIPTGDDLFDLI